MISVSGKFSRTICSRSMPLMPGSSTSATSTSTSSRIHQRERGFAGRGAQHAVVALERRATASRGVFVGPRRGRSRRRMPRERALFKARPPGGDGAVDGAPVTPRPPERAGCPVQVGRFRLWFSMRSALAIAGCSPVVALASRGRPARRLDQLPQSYWELQYRARRVEGAGAALDAGDRQRSRQPEAAPATTTFVPLASLKR